MGLKDLLQNQGSNLTKYNGVTPPTLPGASSQSKLHNEYSINGNPLVKSTMTISPSNLDLDGITPPKYTDNLPG